MKRRAKFSLVVLVLLAGIGTGAYYYFAPRPHPVEVTRSARLLTIAAEEAGGIDVLDERLTRQLNIADLQIQCGQHSEAIKTLALAVSTLHMPEKDQAKPGMDDFRRIAGWTSIAELAHRAGDGKTANESYLNAVESLNSVQPEIKRAEYVLSLSEICHTLRGQAEASQLLVKGGTWASKIENTTVRRYALATFARQLTIYDDLENARAVMRNEGDARWRSDTFAALARQNMNMETEQIRTADASRESSGLAFKHYAEAPVAGARAATAPARTEYTEEKSIAEFNHNLHYDYNYRSDSIQRGLMPR